MSEDAGRQCEYSQSPIIIAVSDEQGHQTPEKDGAGKQFGKGDKNILRAKRTKNPSGFEKSKFFEEKSRLGGCRKPKTPTPQVGPASFGGGVAKTRSDSPV